MQNYVITRHFGNVTLEQLQEGAVRSLSAMMTQFTDIKWDHSHILVDEKGLRTCCLYSAPSPDRIREHAKFAELPLESVTEVKNTVGPKDFEAAAKAAIKMAR